MPATPSKETARIEGQSAIAFTAAIFTAYGATSHHAQVVADHLVGSELRGLPSHGLIRVSQYIQEIRDGRLSPAKDPIVSSQEGATHVVDGQWTFGAVAGMAACDLVSGSVHSHGLGFASVRHVQHTGRLGAYTEPLAAQGFLAVAFASGADRWHRVAPFGAREGRMSTNPISWAIPVTGSAPLVADFSTSVMPEGRIRVMQAAGQPVPTDVICDYEGNATQDPAAFYGTGQWPAPGFLLPLGGARAGHKGYALAMMAESFATLMSGDDARSPERGNNLAVLAIRGDAGLPDRAARMAAYMRSAQPVDPNRPVLAPGDLERRHADQSSQIEVAQTTWDSMRSLAGLAGIAVPGDEGDHG